MKILNEQQHRALAYVRCCETGGHAADKADVARWLNKPQPLSPLDIAAGLTVLRELQGTSGKQVVEHAVSVGWLMSGTPAAKLTPLGRAVLQGLEIEAADTDQVQFVVIDKDDPLSYPLLVGALADLGKAMLIDPYLEVQHLDELMRRTSINKFLIRQEGGDSRRSAITTYLSSPAVSGMVSVRTAPGLHDRLVIADDGRAFSLGISLNGIHKHLSMFVPVPSQAAPALQNHYASLWERGAELVEPTESDEDSDSPDG